MRPIVMCMGVALLSAGCVAPVGVPLGDGVADKLAASPPGRQVVGATAVYRVSNGYRGDARGEIHHRVEQVGADRVVVAVTTDSAFAGPARTDVYTAEGNWLRHPVFNHDNPTQYEFAPPYPAYPFPLDPGKAWSMRVSAKNPANGSIRSMRVDGRVAGGERISTPAGTFDTIKIVRNVYAGDAELFVSQTVITETDWYAPALGRAVRVELRSEWQDSGRAESLWDTVQGDWRVYELLRYAPAAAQ